MYTPESRRVGSTGTLSYVEEKIERASNYPVKVIILVSETDSRYSIEIPMNYTRNHIANMLRDYNTGKRSFSFLNISLRYK